MYVYLLMFFVNESACIIFYDVYLQRAPTCAHLLIKLPSFSRWFWIERNSGHFSSSAWARKRDSSLGQRYRSKYGEHSPAHRGSCDAEPLRSDHRLRGKGAGALYENLLRLVCILASVCDFFVIRSIFFVFFIRFVSLFDWFLVFVN